MTREETIRLLKEMRNMFPSFYNGTDAREMVDIWEKSFSNVDAGIVRRSMFECSIGRNNPPTLTQVIDKIDTYQKKILNAKARYEYFNKQLPDKCAKCNVELWMDVVDKCGAVLCPRMEEWEMAQLESQRSMAELGRMIDVNSTLSAKDVYLIED